MMYVFHNQLYTRKLFMQIKKNLIKKQSLLIFKETTKLKISIKQHTMTILINTIKQYIYISHNMCFVLQTCCLFNFFGFLNFPNHNPFVLVSDELLTQSLIHINIICIIKINICFSCCDNSIITTNITKTRWCSFIMTTYSFTINIITNSYIWNISTFLRNYLMLKLLAFQIH